MKSKKLFLFSMLLSFIGVSNMAYAAVNDEPKTTIGIYIEGINSDSAGDSIPPSPTYYEKVEINKRVFPKTGERSFCIWMNLFGSVLVVLVLLIGFYRSKKGVSTETN